MEDYARYYFDHRFNSFVNWRIATMELQPQLGIFPFWWTHDHIDYRFDTMVLGNYSINN